MDEPTVPAFTLRPISTAEVVAILRTMNGGARPEDGGILGVAADRLESAEAERDRLREALEPSADTKAAYMGEFSFGFPVYAKDGEEEVRSVNVPWTTIKEIMSAIRARAALAAAPPEAPHG